ncbi:hypothetical protein R20233_04837 [Ralstonia sp. LMG 32965]|uniref:hypothetical protein n=1 Tax=Ralstonia flatus TaxID=3058601 RepID=UPI0028F516D7|nr:hypothetical protein [Ralstonia sp. LMG 32965]CAJ0902812.1 hypothetical protein R20233_04837 [Ralstonia sp. LMG 32965]
MRHLSHSLIALALAGIVMPALADAETPSAVADAVTAPPATPTPAEVKVDVTGHIDLAADLGRKVYIEFLASPKLTAAARTALLAQGFTLVDAKDQADVIYELDGAFQALRPATRRTAEVRVGDYAENPAPLATKSGRGGSVMLSLNPLAMLIGTIASNVGNATGAQDSVNAATAGDPDGKCLSRCETWRYRQRNVVNLVRKAAGEEQKCAVLATAEDAELLPARLIQSSLDGLGEAVGLRLAVIELAPAAKP